MKIPTLGRFLAAAGVFLGLAAFAAGASSKSSLVTLGDNTFQITRKATTAFNRDIDTLKAEAQDDAEKYCASHGKQLKVVSLTAKKPLMTLGYSEAKIVFKALDAGDPELSAPAPGMPAAAVAPAPVNEHLSGDLYNDLLKLDDLRKRGILTEEEFQAEKKKVLSRSQ